MLLEMVGYKKKIKRGITEETVNETLREGKLIARFKDKTHVYLKEVKDTMGSLTTLVVVFKDEPKNILTAYRIKRVHGKKYGEAVDYLKGESIWQKIFRHKKFGTPICSRCNTDMRLSQIDWEFEEGFLLRDTPCYKCFKCRRIFFTEEQAMKMEQKTKRFVKRFFGWCDLMQR